MGEITRRMSEIQGGGQKRRERYRDGDKGEVSESRPGDGVVCGSGRSLAGRNALATAGRTVDL